MTVSEFKKRIGEGIFAALCNKKYVWGTAKRSKSIEERLAIQKREWRTFCRAVGLRESDLKGRVVVDFGCGYGYDSLFILQAGARRVICLETVEQYLIEARKLHEEFDMRNGVYLNSSHPAEVLERIGESGVDVVISRNVLEHVREPHEYLEAACAMMKQGASFYLGVDPLYSSPFGAHLSAVCKVPWVHLMFSEKVMVRVLRRLYGLPDNIKRFIDIPGSGVNKLSYSDYENLVKSFGFRIVRRKINWFGTLRTRHRVIRALSCLPLRPGIKDLLIHNVYDLLHKPVPS